MQQYLVIVGVQYLTWFGGSDRWSPNPGLAFAFADKAQAEREAARINARRLGHNKAVVEPIHRPNLEPTDALR